MIKLLHSSSYTRPLVIRLLTIVLAWVFVLPSFAQSPTLYIKDVDVAVCNDVDITVIGDVQSDVNSSNIGLQFTATYDINTMTFTGIPGNFRVSGNINNTGSQKMFLDGDFSKTILNGTSQQSISGGGEVNFHGLTIENASSILFQREASFSDVLDFTQGNIDLNNNNLIALEEVNSLWSNNILGDNRADPMITNEDQSKRIFGLGEVRLGFTDVLAGFMDSNGQNIIGAGATLTQPGLTSISLDRGHVAQPIFGDNSIARYFDIRSNDGTLSPGMFDFKYMDQHDLSGITEADLSFFKNAVDGTNPDSGTTGSWESEAIDNLDQANDIATDNSVDPLTDYRHTLFPCNPPTFDVGGVVVGSGGTPQVDSMNACLDNQVLIDLVNFTEFNPPSTFQWSTNETTQSITVSETSSTTTIYTVTVTDARGCSTVESLTIAWRDLPTVLFPSTTYPDPTNLCENNMLDLDPDESADVVSYNWSTGSTLDILTITGNGSNMTETFSVTVTNNFGCTANASVNIFQIPEPDVDLGADLTDCDGGPVTIDAGSQPAGYTYTWTTGANTQTIDVNTTNFYGVTITTPQGCKNNDSLQVFISDIMLDDMVQDVDCHGNANGSIDLIVTDGIAPYMYNWTSIGGYTSNVEDPSGLSGDTYTVTVTDDKGCTETRTIQVMEPPALAFASIDTMKDLCGMGTGSVTVSGSGGTPPYTFAWSTGGTGPSITNLNAGTYFVTMTDANSCQLTASATVTGPGSLLGATLAADEITCNMANDGKLEVTASGGTPPYTYAWSKDFQPFGGTTNMIDNLGPGTYGVTVTDMYACTFELSQQLVEPVPIVILPVSQTNVTCFGGNDGAINTTITGPNPFTILWSNGETTEDISNLSAGNYSVTVTYNNNSNCTETRNYTITQPTEITQTQENITHDYCMENMGEISVNMGGGTAPLAYAWSTGATTTTISNLASGVYSLTVTDANSCTKEFQYQIQGPSTGQALSIFDFITNVSCHGANDGQIQLTVSGGNGNNSFNWSGPTSIGNNSSANNLTPGTYNVTVTDLRGCTKTGTYDITEPLNIDINGTVSNVTCAGDSNGAIDLTVTASNPYTVAWSNGATTEDLSGLGTGTYTVTVTYNGNSNCTATEDFMVTESSPITTNPQVTNDNCGDNNGQIVLNATGGTGMLSFAWSNNATTPDISGLGAGTYTVTVTDQNSCTFTQDLMVTAPSAALNAAGAVQEISCNGANNGSVTMAPMGGTSPYTYNWSTGASTATISNLSPGTYLVTVTDNNSCTATASFNIQDPAVLDIASNTVNNISCNGAGDGSIQINVVGGGVQSYTYAWSNGASTSTINSLGAGTYSVTVTGNAGCTDTESYTIIEPAVLSANPQATADLCFAGSGQIILNPSGGTGNTNTDFMYNWSNSVTTQDNPNLNPGTYTVTITDMNGCTLVQSATVNGPSQPMSIAATPMNTSCLGASDGSINLNITGGAAPLTYNWSNGSSGNMLSNIAAGTYSVTVTDANNCTAEATGISVADPAAIAVVGNETNVSCNGANDGSINLTVTGGGVQSYTYNWSNSATTANINGLAPGAYSVTVTGNSGCTKTASFNITEPSVLALLGNATDGVCGLTDGTIDLIVSGGTAPYTFNWSNGASTEDLSNLAAATYNVTVTDANSCTQTMSFNVGGPSSVLALSSSSTNITCPGMFNGSIDITATGGATPYTYNWSNGASTEDLNSLPPGLYNLTVTDNNGCTKTESVTITEPAFLNLSASIQDASAQGANDGAVDLSVTGGTGPYTYNWSNSATTQDLSGVTNGVYMVTVTDANGCTKSDSYFVSYPSVIQVMVNKMDESCDGMDDGSIDLTVSGGTSPYTFNWSNSANTEDISGLAPGLYQVTIDDNGGNQFVQAVNIQSANPFSIFSTAVNNVCAGSSNGSIDVTVSGGASPYTYNWSNGTNNQDLSNLIGGMYALTVTDNNGCTQTLNASLTDPAGIIIASAPMDATGNGLLNGSINLTITGGSSPYTFMWSSGQITEDITGLGAGDYMVTVTDQNSCTATTTITVNQPQPLTINSNVTTISCFGQTDGAIDITAMGGVSPYMYAWSNSSTNEDQTGLDNGTYQVTVTDNNGNTATAAIDVTEPGAIMLTGVPKDVKCNGGSDGEVDLTVNGGTGPFTYNWSNSATTEDVTNLAPGTYNVTVTDANSCTANAGPFTINEPPGLSLSINVTHVTGFGLSNGGIDLTVNGGQPPITYAWTTGTITQDLTNIPAGTYGVTVSDVNLVCTIIDMIMVNQPAQLGVSVNETDITCNGQTDGMIDLTVTGGVSPYTFNWSNSSNNEDLSGLAAGDYTFTLTDDNGITVTQTVTIDEPAVLQATGVASNASCNGQSDGGVMLTVQGGTGPYTYNWSNSSSAQNLQNVGQGSYSVTVTDNNGCTTMAGAFNITEPAAITLNLSATDVTVNGQSNGSIDLTVNGGSSPYTYNWSSGQISEDLSNLFAGTYMVTVTDNNNCTATGSVDVMEPAALSLTGTHMDISCNGQTDGSIDITVMGGTTPYTYNWSNGASTEDLTGLAAGNYEVTVTDNSGSTQTFDATIDEPQQLTVQGMGTNILCNGQTTGSVAIDVFGGTQPYTFNWSNSASTEDLMNIGTGDYSVTVTDNSGCTATAGPFTITEPTAMSLTFTQTNVTTNGGNDGAIDITVMGGTTPYMYNWSTGQTFEDLNSLTAGNYMVTVTDANGCTITESIDITEPLAFTISGMITHVSCGGAMDGAVDLTVMGGVMPYTFNWSNSANTEDISGLAGGIYEVTVTDNNGNTQMGTYQVNEATPMMVIGNVMHVSCFGQTNGGVDITASGGDGNYTYAWSNSTSNEDLSGVGAGTYTVTVTDGNSCTVTGTYTIDQPTEIMVTGNVTPVSCSGNSDGAIDITVSGGSTPYTFLWSSGQVTEDISNVLDGNYTVTVTDANSCTTTQNFTIMGATTIMITETIMNVSCNGQNNGSISLSITGGATPYNIVWSSGQSGQSNIMNLDGGNYNVTITDANNCVEDEMYMVTEPTALTVNAFVQPAGCGGSTNDGYIDLSVSGGTTAYMYSWSTGATTEVLGNLTTGPYMVTVTDANSCTNTQSFTINDSGGATLDANFLAASPAPSEQNIQFVDVSFPVPLSWKYSFADPANTMSTSPNPTFAYPNDPNSPTTTYPAKLVVESTVCRDSIIKMIQIMNTEPAPPNLDDEEFLIGLRPDFLRWSSYPNPTDDVLFIEIFLNKPYPVDLRLFDVAGKQLFYQKLEGKDFYNTFIETRNLPEGAYLINAVIRDGPQKTVKIIVDHPGG